MTGFGKSEITLPTKKISVEVRSLNSKQLDLSVKLPGIYRPFEFDIRSMASAAIIRGKADISVMVEHTATNTSATINKEVFSEYMRQIGEAMNYAGVYAANDAIVPVAMRMPDVVTSEEQDVSDDELKAIVDATEQAAAQLDAFRVQEGAILIADLLSRIDLIEKYRAESLSEAEKGTKFEELIRKAKLSANSTDIAKAAIYYAEHYIKGE